MWNALRKKVNKSSRSYQLSSGSHNQSDSEDSDASDSSAPTKVVLKRYMKISSCSEGLADAATATITSSDSVDPAVTVTGTPPSAPRYENPYASLDIRARASTTHTDTETNRETETDTERTKWSTVDNARHHPLLLRDDAAPRDGDTMSSDRRNNNHTDDDVTRGDDVIIAGAEETPPDGNANHFGGTAESMAAACSCRLSPPRLKRREKASTSTSTAAVVTRHSIGHDDDLPTNQRRDHVIANDVTYTSDGHVAVATQSTSSNLAADDEESGYSTLSDILGQVQRAMLEQQHQQQLQVLCVSEDHAADSDLDTSGDCRDIDLEQAGRCVELVAGRSRSVTNNREQQVMLTTQGVEQPLSCAPGAQSSVCETQDVIGEKAEQTDQNVVDENRNHADLSADEAQSGGEVCGVGDYDVPRSTPVSGWRDSFQSTDRRVKPPAPSDDTDAASATPVDGTPRSQASCSTLKDEPQTADEPAAAAAVASASTCQDSMIHVELSGEMLIVSEPTHMSWEEVMESAHVLGIPLQPQQRPPPAIMTRSDSAAVRRSSTSSSVTSSDCSFVSSPVNSPGARCRTSAPPVVLPRHLITRRAVSSSPSTKQNKAKKTVGKGASPFREKLQSLFARKAVTATGDDRRQWKLRERGSINASPTAGGHRRSGSDKSQQQRNRRDDVTDSSHHRPAPGTAGGGGGHSVRLSAAEMSPSAADLINCGYRESMLSVLSSSFSSGSLGSIFSHASSSVSSSNSSSVATGRHHRHQYHRQPSSSSSSSSSAWRNSFAGQFAHTS